MHNRLYRVIFHRARGLLMVLGVAVLWPVSGAADIIADHSAPAHQQATVLSTANGLP